MNCQCHPSLNPKPTDLWKRSCFPSHSRCKVQCLKQKSKRALKLLLGIYHQPSQLFIDLFLCQSSLTSHHQFHVDTASDAIHQLGTQSSNLPGTDESFGTLLHTGIYKKMLNWTIQNFQQFVRFIPQE